MKEGRVTTIFIKGGKKRCPFADRKKEEKKERGAPSITLVGNGG